MDRHSIYHYLGETFRSTDARNDNRRVRITTHKDTRPDGRRRFRGVVVTDEGNPKAVGRHVTLLDSTLDSYYERVSH